MPPRFVELLMVALQRVDGMLRLPAPRSVPMARAPRLDVRSLYGSLGELLRGVLGLAAGASAAWRGFVRRGGRGGDCDVAAQALLLLGGERRGVAGEGEEGEDGVCVWECWSGYHCVLGYMGVVGCSCGDEISVVFVDSSVGNTYCVWMKRWKESFCACGMQQTSPLMVCGCATKMMRA